MVINLTEEQLIGLIGIDEIDQQVWEKFWDAWQEAGSARDKLLALKLQRESILKERDALSAILQTNAQKIDEIYAKFPELDTEQ